MTFSVLPAQVQSLLQTYYDAIYLNKSSFEVQGVTSLTSGWENEVYTFNLISHQGNEVVREPLVLRLYAGNRSSEKAEHEFHSMRRLRDSGYPVPLVHILEISTTHLGAPFIIMERFNGNDLWLTFSTATNERKQALRSLFCHLFTRLHALDPQTIILGRMAVSQPYEFIDEYLHRERIELQQSLLSDLMPYVDWLQARREFVSCTKLSVVHTDFHYNNVLLRNDDFAVVIDWAGLRISDARFDLGWMLMLQRTHIDVEERNLLLTEYLRLSPISMPHIEWFEIHAALWRVRNAVALLLRGPEAIGAHASANDMVKNNLRPISRAYAFLAASTSIRVEGVERALVSHGGPSDLFSE